MVFPSYRNKIHFMKKNIFSLIIFNKCTGIYYFKELRRAGYMSIRAPVRFVVYFQKREKFKYRIKLNYFRQGGV